MMNSMKLSFEVIMNRSTLAELEYEMTPPKTHSNNNKSYRVLSFLSHLISCVENSLVSPTTKR